MDILKTVPILKDYLWGGEKLKEYHKKPSGKIAESWEFSEKIAESWEFSLHPDGLTLTDQGKTLYSLLVEENFAPLGIGIHPEDTPILKLIQAEQSLSVQVHPVPEKGGKDEMWLILEAEPGSFLYLGSDLPAGNLAPLCKTGDILRYLKKVHVQAGEQYRIPAGTVHAIGDGLTIFEIQQNSNLTYRLYDYGRKDKNGKTRPLHIQKAEEAIRDGKNRPAAPFFSVCRRTVAGEITLPPKTTFFTLTLIDGSGSVSGLPAQKGDTFFIPCQTPAILSGNFTFVEVCP